jgi:hypothetical protein
VNNAFLGKSERLLEVHAHDMETLERIGKAPEDISNKMLALRHAYMPAYNECISESRRDGKFEVETNLVMEGTLYRGREFCPFIIRREIRKGILGLDLRMSDIKFDDSDNPCPTISSGSWDFIIRNTLVDAELFFSDLAIHMIHAHHFFGGQVCKYRVDPLNAAYVLGLIEADMYESEKARLRLHDYELSRMNLYCGKPSGRSHYLGVIIERLTEEGLSDNTLFSIKAFMNDGDLYDVAELYRTVHSTYEDGWRDREGNTVDFSKMLEEKGILEQTRKIVEEALIRAMEIHVEEGAEDTILSVLNSVIEYARREWFPDHIMKKAEELSKNADHD